MLVLVLVTGDGRDGYGVFFLCFFLFFGALPVCVIWLGACDIRRGDQFPLPKGLTIS